jgi:hypothetical protein
MPLSLSSKPNILTKISQRRGSRERVPMMLQGFHQRLVVHGMEGFDYERARKELRIPDEFQVEAMAAVGKPGPKELLPEKLQARESPNDRWKVSESVFEGPFKSQ